MKNQDSGISLSLIIIALCLLERSRIVMESVNLLWLTERMITFTGWLFIFVGFVVIIICTFGLIAVLIAGFIKVLEK